MMYSGSSTILSQGVATATQIDLWFAVNGRLAAKKFAPDRQYKPAPDGLGQMIIDACKAFPVRVNHDLVAGDIAKEAAFWQSAIVRSKNNPSGLGATNDNPQGNAKTFATPYEGILATVAHMLVYFVGEGPWVAFDPRADAVRNEGWMGVAKVLSDLDGKWAWPGNGYGASVATYGNRLLETQTNEDNNMSAQIPGFVWHGAAPTHYTVGRATKIVGGAQHYSAGTNSLGWLTKDSGRNDPNKRVSATFLIKHNPTLHDRGWQLVRIEDTAWTTGSWANPRTVSIEYEHKPDVHGAVPDEAYTVIAQTWLDVSEYLNANPHLGSIEISRSGIKGHKEWVGNPSLTCPDGVDVDRIVQRALEIRNGGAQPDIEEFPNGHTLRGAFLELYRKARSADVHWRIIGVPIGEEVHNVPVGFVQPDGTVKIIASTVQQTDRGGGWLLFNPETQVATMASNFERKQIEKHLDLQEGLGPYILALEELADQMRKEDGSI